MLEFKPIVVISDDRDFNVGRTPRVRPRIPILPFSIHPEELNNHNDPLQFDQRSEYKLTPHPVPVNHIRHDSKHLSHTTEAQGRYFPLNVECLGIAPASSKNGSSILESHSEYPDGCYISPQHNPCVASIQIFRFVRRQTQAQKKQRAGHE